MLRNLILKIKTTTILFIVIGAELKCMTSDLIFQVKQVPKAEKIISELDSLSHDSVIELNSRSRKFELFVLLYNSTSENELKHLIEKHPNPAIKGYAYMGLMLKEYKGRDSLIKKHYKKVKIKTADMVKLCNESATFISLVNKRKERIKRVVNDKQREYYEEEEKRTIIHENIISKEQGEKNR